MDCVMSRWSMKLRTLSQKRLTVGPNIRTKLALGESSLAVSHLFDKTVSLLLNSVGLGDCCSTTITVSFLCNLEEGTKAIPIGVSDKSIHMPFPGTQESFSRDTTYVPGKIYRLYTRWPPRHAE